jgi:hypothetical protein
MLEKRSELIEQNPHDIVVRLIDISRLFQRLNGEIIIVANS